MEILGEKGRNWERNGDIRREMETLGEKCRYWERNEDIRREIR